MKTSRTKKQTKDSWSSVGLDKNFLKRLHGLAKSERRSAAEEIRFLIEEREKEVGIVPEDIK